jgi:hypothetical protein
MDHKLNLTPRERSHIASEIDRRTSAYLHLMGLLKNIAESENTNNLETYDDSEYHLTRNRK